MTDEFDFTVGLLEHWDHPGPPVYLVELPHQCDGWTITAEPDKAVAMATMRRFISEARTAYAKLRKLP